MVEIATPLAPFLRRPPTPPKESTSKLPNENDLGHDLPHSKALDTPDESPSSSAECLKSGSERRRKKVIISAWKHYHQPPSVSSKGYDSDDLRQLPPSRECKSTTSILKRSNDVPNLDGSNDLLIFDNSSLPAMLRSAILHMANDSRSSRLDAYNSLLACLSTYEDIPNTQELVANVADIIGFVRRDVIHRVSDGASIDIQLATQALKLVTVFLCLPSLVEHVPEDFRHFIIEQSIASIADEKAPKILISHYMHLLEKQKFGPRIMNTERVIRLLSALETVTARVKGTRIVGHRLMIYQRLLGQAKSTMASRSGSWINHLISGLLCNIKEIRIRATTFGTEAGIQLGTSSSVSQAFLAMLDHQSPDGKKVVELLCARMEVMTSSKEDGQYVPPMWSVAILFLRSRRRQIECWDHLKMWLGIIEKCFNAGDIQVKLQANIAWNRLVFGINIDTSTTSSMAKMLKAPIVTLLERKPHEKTPEKNIKMVKQIARSSYCNLLYYALRPGAPHAQLDQYWDLYVADLLTKSFTASAIDVDHACEIMSALLFNSGPPRIWNENKANMIGPVTFNELPCIDPKWIRSRTGKIMYIFEKLFDLADWALDDDREAPIVVTWRNFMAALGSASSKEIKVSSDTVNAIAQIVNQIQHFLVKNRALEVSSATFNKIDILVHHAISGIGALALNEKRLVLTAQSAFEAASETPSGRLKTNPATLNSAAIHILQVLLKSTVGPENAAYIGVMTNVVQVALEPAHSRNSQLHTLRNISRLCTTEEDAISTRSKMMLWQVIADAGFSSLQMQRVMESRSGSPQYPGHEYRDVVKILEIGIQHHSKLTSPSWQKLYDQLVKTVEREIGAAGVTLMVVEPLASLINNSLLRESHAFFIHVAVKLVERLYWLPNRQSIERTHMQLWGAIPGQHKLSAPDISQGSYSMISTSLKVAYKAAASLPQELLMSLLSAVTSVMHACSHALKAKVLERLQHGLAIWIEDSEGKLTGPENTILPKVKKLWALVATLLESLQESGSEILSKMYILVAAGLKSRHRAILNDAVLMWNRIFGCAESLDYPDDLRNPLLKLKLVTDIDLPGFPDQTSEEGNFSPFRFIDSQNAGGLEPDRLTPELQLPPFATPLKKKASFHRPSPSPLPSARRSVKSTPKARLRHDDSQIQFAAVESSPLVPTEHDSQILTERQKEVRERQGQEAAMFPEIRSSPRTTLKVADHSLPRLDLKSKGPVQAPLDVDDDTSPTFPPDNMMNGFLGSSPTPNSSRHRSQERYSEDRPASSPPFVSSHLQIPRLNSPSPGLWPQVSSDPVEKPSEPAINAELRNEVVDDQPQAEKLHESPLSARTGLSPKNNILSDQDVFVDAPSDPHIHSKEGLSDASKKGAVVCAGVAPNSVVTPSIISADKPEPKQQANARLPREGEVSKVMNSFQNEANSRYSADDEQAAAQLLNEMEEARSQQAQHQTPATSRASSKKRKASSDGNPRKRARALSNSLESTVIRAAPSTGEVIADCVLVDSRPARSVLHINSPQVVVKRERSESPPARALLSSMEQTPLPGRRGSGRRRPLRRSQPADQARTSTRRSGRKTSIKQEAPEDSEQQGLRPKGRTRRSTGMGDLPRSSPMSSDPLHGDDDILLSSVSSSAIEVPRPDAALTHPVPPLLSRTPAAEQGDVAPTGQSILERFRQMFEDLQSVALGPEEERAMVTLLFGSVQQIHDAGRRHSHA